MKLVRLGTILLCIGAFKNTLPKEQYITYLLNNGRLGDNIVNYCKCRWAAHKNNIQFIPKEFPLSEYFFEHEDLPQGLMQKRINNENEIQRYPNKKIIFLSTFYLKTDDFQVMREDQQFMTDVRNVFCRIPKHNLPIPEDHISIAIHVRKGSAEDPPLLNKNQVALDFTATEIIGPKIESITAINPRRPKPKQFADRMWPLKFPPNEYYIEQLARLIQLLPEQKLFVYIFTDHQEPLHLKTLFEEHFAGIDTVTFACRDNDMGYHNVVIDDFIAMMHFDCLIRSESNFAKMIHFLGFNKIILYPLSYQWYGNYLKIDKSKLINYPLNTEIIFDTHGKEE